MDQHETTDYRRIAVVGGHSGVEDALEKERDPSGPCLHLRAGTQLLRLGGDVAALRMFEFAWAQAFGRTRLRLPQPGEADP